MLDKEGRGERQQAQEMEMRGKNATNIWKLGTWNIRGIRGKEVELVDEFEKAGLEILAISETKKKGKGRADLTNGHILIYSGVPDSQRAAAGVGCVIHKKLKDQIVAWKNVSERILQVELGNIDEIITVISVYGPDENEKAEEKERFWETLTTATEEAKGTIYIAGDFNSRVGKEDIENKAIVGRQGEETRNNNGKRMLEFCRLQDLIITNTFFQHKDVHKYTRTQPNRREKSIIDYILAQRERRKNVLDVKVRRSAEIYSDHFLLVAKIRQNHIRSSKPKSRKENHITVKTYKLRNRDTAREYQQETEKRIQDRLDEIKQESTQQGWNILKNIIIGTATEICGVYKKDNRRKQTAWWTKEIREEVESKKKEWKKYLIDNSPEQYEIYKNQRRRVKELVQAAKQKSWIEFGNRMEKDSNGNQKLFYRVLKSFRTEKQEKELYIRNKKQEILTNEIEVMKRWREYFQELLGQQTQITDENVIEPEDEDPGEEEGVGEFEMTELEKVIGALKTGKTPGSDKITTEMIKNLGEIGKEAILEILNKAWLNEKMPQEWGVALIMPIHKKGDPKQCDNYRGITLLNTVTKIYEQIINNRLKPIIDPQLSESQSGFRPGRSTQDHIFTIKQIIEKRQLQNKNLYLAFIDIKKAFDSVPRAKVWKSLKERGVHNKIVRVVEDIYRTNINQIIRNNMKSEGFVTEMGLRQGGGLSPTLFNVYMDKIIKKCEKETSKMFVGYKNLKRVEIAEGVFVDDVVLLAGNERQLQVNLDIWKKTMEEEGMNINADKTKILVIGEQNIDTEIKVDNVKIEQVKEYKYLGILLDETGKQEAEINERVGKTIKLYYAMNQKFINKREISKQTKVKVFNTVYRPVLTYGCESWALTNRQRSKIQAMEMKYLRRILGKTRRDKIRNTQIREELGMKPVLQFIEQRQLSWWGHIQRMSADRPVRQIYEARIQTKRRRGRPRQTWNKIVSLTLQERGKTWKEATALARDRNEWRKFIYE